MAATRSSRSVDDSAIARALRVAAGRPPWSEHVHRGYGKHMFAWGQHWVQWVLQMGRTTGPATWKLSVLALEDHGWVEVDCAIFDRTWLSSSFVCGEQLVVVRADERRGRTRGERHTFDALLFTKASNGSLRSAGAVPPGPVLHSLVANSGSRVIGKDVLLARDGGELVVYRTTDGGFPLAEVGRKSIAFSTRSGKHLQSGFSSADMCGPRVVVAGPGDGTGFKLIDISEPASMVEIGQRPGKRNQQNLVRFVGEDRVLAFGRHGKAKLMSCQSSKLLECGTAKVRHEWGHLCQLGDEVVLYADPSGNATNSGCLVCVDPADYGVIGEIEFPFPVREIFLTHEHLILFGPSSTAAYRQVARWPAKYGRMESCPTQTPHDSSMSGRS